MMQLLKPSPKILSSHLLLLVIVVAAVAATAAALVVLASFIARLSHCLNVQNKILKEIQSYSKDLQ